MLGRYARRFMEESRSWGANPMASCGFCAYAGIGATYLWDADFAAFWKGSIVDQLAKPRGFECMDEYIASVPDLSLLKLIHT